MITAKLKKGNHLGFILVMLILIVSLTLLFSADVSAEETERLELIAEEVVSGGPPPDGIPPIEDPQYLSIEDADPRIGDSTVVFVAEFEKETYIYPQNIMVWHEIVNEEIAGEKKIITYCPLTGSALGFKGNISAGQTTMGTSGNLVNSNLVMYDRETDSYWPQILGRAIEGELKGEVLEEFPVIWTRWELAKDYYDEARVLSRETGFARDYDRDPYGSYAVSGDYYDSGGPIFPVMNQDEQFEDKKVVIAGRLNRTPFSLSKNRLAADSLINFTVNEEELVAIYDDNLDTARVFLSSYNNEEIVLNYDEGEIRDEQTNSVWNERGQAISGELTGAELDQVNAFDVMWFAWYAFYPESKDNLIY